ncbi:formylmethanofuran dehydrogenase subunit C [Derxia gummosa]|uniref:Formylmethanofuran dehydrogenase subunit C n=1 Tax=Derxia gummosa DSM 723 TaxID=1121388 RepID=A0A8B6X3C6_9BURK|nr:formylmethanofuran dehydrogenase subunit C [Derxia gummosa]
MSTIRLQLRAAPRLRVNLGGVLPSAELTVTALASRRVLHGHEAVALGDLFRIDEINGSGDAPALVFQGELARFDRIGAGLAAGRVAIEGDAGDYVGLQMTGGRIELDGSAGDLLGCEMAGGRIDVAGNAGDYVAGALPGSMDGMRGGDIIIGGNAGERLGDRMRRGTVAVHGDAGAFCGSRMVAGTIALAGAVGEHCGYGQRRGSLVFAGPAPAIPDTFVPAEYDHRVIWQLLARSLAKRGGRFATLPQRKPARHAGDVAAGGKGEWWIAA